MQRERRQAGRAELAGEQVGVALGRGEDDRLGDRVVDQAVAQQVELVVDVVDVDHVLVDRVVRGHLVLDLQPLRRVQQPVGELAHAVRQRGGEAHGLAVARQRLGDAEHLLGEAHVEHAVGLVEHQHLDAREVDAARVELVDQAARRSHEDLVRRREQAVLHRVGLAAGDAHGGGARDVLREVARGLGDLLRELAGGREHQHARPAAAARLGREHARERRQHERGGLAGAGGRAGDQVIAREQQRDRAALDGRGLLDAELRQRGEQRGGQAEFGKGRVRGSHSTFLRFGSANRVPARTRDHGGWRSAPASTPTYECRTGETATERAGDR